jgi:hypothetical protein
VLSFSIRRYGCRFKLLAQCEVAKQVDGTKCKSKRAFIDLTTRQNCPLAFQLSMSLGGPEEFRELSGGSLA